MTKLTIRAAIEWLWENRGLSIRREYLSLLCNSNRIKSELLGNLRFINIDDLEEFEFKKPGRPKNDK